MKTKRLARAADGVLQDKDPQVFPWDGRETFVFETIPKLMGLRPERALDFYQYAAYFAGLPDQMHQEFLEEEALRFVDAVAALAPQMPHFEAGDKIRPGLVREYLSRYHTIEYRCNQQGGFDWYLAEESRGVIGSENERQWLTLALEAAEIHMRRNGDARGLKP
ncbi:MAG: hypothetical protein ABIY70_08775 [Capsulimonas sp.]|uniref:hypothetical protein n=1 Tax=Capsulimonas sp. TaxID=2494211 RepID=UPI0032634B2E